MTRKAGFKRHPSTDASGRDLRVGDWVRVIRVPDSIARMHRDTKRAFSRAVGKTFQIEAFDETGELELDLAGKVGRDTIWLEPFCAKRYRRPRKSSLRFRRVLKIRRRLDRPRWSLPYLAKYRPIDNPDLLVVRFDDGAGLVNRLGNGAGQGWFVREDRREIHGTFYAPDKTRSSKRRLEQLREALRKNHPFVSLRLARIRVST